MSSNEDREMWTSYVFRLHGYVFFFFWPNEDRKPAFIKSKIKIWRKCKYVF